MSVQKIVLPMLLFVWLMGSVVHAAPDSQTAIGHIYSVAWSPDNQSYATGHGNGTIKIWDTSTKELLSTFSIMQDPNSSLIVVDLDWSPDCAKIAATAHTSTGYARTQVLDASNGTVLASFDAGALAGDVAWSPDGSLLAGTFNPGYPPNVIGVLKVWETATWTEVVSSDQAGSAILALDWSPDGAYLASGDASGIIEMWNTAEWVYRSYLPAASAPEGVSQFAWSPDGSRLAAMGDDPSLVNIWNPTSRTVLLTLDCGEKSVLYDITWQPTGEHLAGVCSTLGSSFVRIWDTESGSFIDQGSSIGILDRIDWSPQGDMLLYSSSSQTVPHVNEAFNADKN